MTVRAIMPRIAAAVNRNGMLTNEWVRFLSALSGRVAAAQADSTAADVAALKADFNALLEKLRAAGLMETE